MKRKITISERQLINTIKSVINEARRNSETNVDKSFTSFYNKMIEKAPIENIFVSFREDTHVTDVNPVNVYNTPTGFYSYPLSTFAIPENPTEDNFRGLFPFGNDREYINFFILKTHDGILTEGTDKSTLDMYVERIKKLHPNVVEVHKLCDSFIANTYSSDYINEDPERQVYHMTHLFWLFLYDVAKAVQAGNIQNRINLICREIGVNGFIDYGDKYIHRLEPMQAVFFKIKNLGKTFIYEKPRISGAFNKRAVQNKEHKVIQKLTSDIKLIKVLGYYGLADNSGKIISKGWFDFISNFYNGYARVKLNNMWNLINENGNLISPKKWYNRIGYFEKWVATVELNGKSNFINQDGELLSSKWFDQVGNFRDGLAMVKLGDKWSFISEDGELAFPDKWFDNIDSFNHGLAKVELNGKYNFIKKDGELVSLKWFNFVDDFYDKFIRVESDGKWNFITRAGKLLSPKKWFDWIGFFENGVAKVKLNGEWCNIGEDGERVLSKQMA